MTKNLRFADPSSDCSGGVWFPFATELPKTLTNCDSFALYRCSVLSRDCVYKLKLGTSLQLANFGVVSKSNHLKPALSVKNYCSKMLQRLPNGKDGFERSQKVVTSRELCVDGRDPIPHFSGPPRLPCLEIDFCVIGLWCSTLYLSRAVPHYSCIFSDGIYGCHWFAGTKSDLRDAAHSEPHSKPRNSALVVISTELDHQKDWIEKT